MLKPKLRATRSIPSKVLLLGKRATVSKYPGKNSTNGSPRAIRRALEGKRVIIRMSKTVIMLSSRRSF